VGLPAGWSAVDPQLFAATALTIGVAELPDKTSLATVLLATRGHPAAVFAGVAAAFVIQSLVAVACGSLLALCPRAWVRIAAGVLFLGFALAMWWRRDAPAEKVAGTDGGFWATAGTAFLVIFIAEWGDLTQIASATLTAQTGKPLTVLLAAIAALWAVSALAIAAGNRLGAWVHPQVVQRLGAMLFALIGVLILSGLGPMM
jgi:putative Ca2+/H+ antiporter (TMEM165/GDT1 family)